MKKFFMALLRGLAYFGIYLGAQFAVQMVWGTVIGFILNSEYAAQGLSTAGSEYLKRYVEDSMRMAEEAAIPMTVVSNILAILVTSLIFICNKKKVTKEMSLRKFHAGAVAPIIMLGLGMNVLTTVVLGLLPEKILDSYQQSSSWTSTDVGIMTILLTVVMAPLAEEWIMRGLVYSRMRKGMPVIAAMLISSLLFGTLHKHPVWIAYAAVLGMVLAWVFERTKSLYAAILLHFSFNLCGMLLGFLPETAPDWVGVAIVAIAVVFTAVGAFLFVRVPKAEEPVEEVVAVAGPVAEGAENL